MKRQLRWFFLKNVFLILPLSFAFTSCETTQPILDDSAEKNIYPPYWAPAYDNTEQVQYYYLPDLEIYYDVWASEFVYLDAGQWVFSPFLPPMYMLYDLRSAPVVILDFRVHEPWRFHELYVSHYPRYYFQSIPAGPGLMRPRGLDENVNKPVFYGTGEYSSSHADSIKKSLPLISTSPSMVSPNKTQRAKYNGKTTGRPVKVDKKMMKPKENSKKATESKEPKKTKPQVNNSKKPL